MGFSLFSKIQYLCLYSYNRRFDFSGREPSKTRDSSTSRKTTKISKPASPIYIDLAYIPHYGNPYYTSLEFFKRIRARYYVFSGTDPSKEVLNALLEAKKSWENPDLGKFMYLQIIYIKIFFMTITNLKVKYPIEIGGR